MGAATQVLCDQCLAGWQQAPQGFGRVSSGPNPAAAAALGVIPGVGAMYNGQFFKGLLHVVIFAVLISIADHYDIFGIFIAAWVVYQSFEAYHVARARRDGLPVPDPLGLNEVGNWLHLSWNSRTPADDYMRAQQQQQGVNPGPQNPNPGFQNPGSWGVPNPNPIPNPGQGEYHGAYQAPPYQPMPNQPYDQPPGFPPMPPVPPPPPYWRRREPIGAVILIGLGLIFLLNEMGWVTERIVEYTWPLVLIALGLWMILRRVGDTKGGPQQ